MTEAKHLDSLRTDQNPEELVSVTCLCHGPLCCLCHKNRVHASGTNSYDEETNTIGHWAWFAGSIPCSVCRLRRGERHES